MLHIIWDLDGTLIDSRDEIVYTIELALQDAGLSISDTIAPVRIGPPLDVMLRQVFPVSLLSSEKLAEVIAFFRKRYDNSDFKMTVPFSGIEKIICDTRHFMHHIVTNKPDLATKRILEKFCWSNYFDSIATPYTKRDIKQSKTALFGELIDVYKDEYFAGIGDMQNDCLAAKNNGIVALGVLWGTGAREELQHSSDFLFENVDDLYDFLHFYAKQMEYINDESE